MKTIDEIRRENLLLAIKRFGTAEALAEAAGVSAPYLSQVKNGQPESKTGKPKSLGAAVARKIDAALNEPPGWMDAPHDEAANEPLVVDIPPNYIDVRELNKLFSLYSSATPKGRANIMASAEAAQRAISRRSKRNGD